MTEDIYTEPSEIDVDTLKNLGPLARMAGIWEGSRSMDVNPKAFGPERQVFVERIELQPIDPQANGPQLFYGLRYHTHIVKPDERETYHDQVGYWLWEPATGNLIQTLAIPRGQIAMAFGRADKDATSFELVATRGETTNGICSNPFLEHAFKTMEYRIKITTNADGTWEYEEDTVLMVLGQTEPFHHTDRNVLTKIGEPTRNPLAIGGDARVHGAGADRRPGVRWAHRRVRAWPCACGKWRLASATHIGYGQPDAWQVFHRSSALVIERCLMRNPDERWQSAADVKRELDWLARTPPVPTAGAASKRRSQLTWIAAFAVGILVVGAVIGYVAIRMRPAVEPARALQLSVNPPPGAALRLQAGSAISPDGRLLAFVAGDATARIWVRPLDAPAARELPGTDGALFPFWSPDSKSIGFFASGKLKRTDVSGGAPVTLCNVVAGRGGTWNAAGLIVFNGYNDGPLLQISAGGGEPKPLTTVDHTKGENSHRWPQFLPDGRTIIFTVRADDNAPQSQGIYLTSLDRPEAKRRLVADLTSGWYASGINGQLGHLLWVRNDRLVAQALDPVTGALAGDSVSLADGPFISVNSNHFFSASAAGTLFYEKAPSRNRQLSWFSREGKSLAVVGAADLFADQAVKLSPDGKQAALGTVL